MDEFIFADLYTTVQIEAVVYLELAADESKATNILVKTKTGDAYKIAAVRFKQDTAAQVRKIFEAQKHALLVSCKSYTAAIPWGEIAAIYTEPAKAAAKRF